MKATLFFALLCTASLASAETGWIEDTDGELMPNEYRTVDPNGAVTRRPCPYNCAMRDIPKSSCKEWKSITNAVDGECYVQDLRISHDDVMPKDTRSETADAMAGYRK